jgi:glycyl-tRNA synthetase beta chain
MHPEFFEFDSIDDYREKMLKGKVIIQPQDRKKRVVQEGRKQAEARGFYLVEDDKLLDEIAGLTEFPIPILGEIPKELLLIPEEVIITSMREHQKFLSLRSSASGKVEGFLVIADLQTHDKQKTILSGNMRVLNSRLRDAIFFYQNDLNLVKVHGMKAWNDKLKSVRFHEKLGSQYDRVERIVKIAILLSRKFDLEQDGVRKAANLIKTDLVSSIVAEFPSLQGIMGAHYAEIEGCEKLVSDAIRDHYLPVGSNNVVPKQPLSIVLALSDKIDYLTSLWQIGIKPTGNKDPFALRRTSLGIIRIILENKLDVDLDYLIDLTKVNFDMSDLQLFLKERIINYLTEKNYQKKVVAVYKRVFNLLSSNKALISSKKKFSKECATEDDKTLQKQLTLFKEQVEDSLQQKDFKKALLSLGSMVNPVNQFLDNVQVNCEDKELRNLRYSLLSEISETMDSVVVFSEFDKK